MKNNFSVLLFYKYINFKEPEKFRECHLEFCNNNNILGRVFISVEGINGTVSGLKEDISKYKAHLTSYPEFEDIWFKEDDAEEHAFFKMHCRVKKEIVSSGIFGVNTYNGGKRLKPEQLNEFYDSGKEFVIIDTRNDYESEIGKFKNALTPPLKTFRDWKEYVDNLDDFKNKTIITYCTGGIRCEKASAYLKEKGFADVYQLDGGIVTYTKDYPDKYWEGAIYVFDERRIIQPNKSQKLKNIGSCYFCGKPTSYYINCHNQDCDKRIVTCHDCKKENDYSCSEQCRKSGNRRKAYSG